ncbi:Do family serine endopeptidase [Marinicella sp. S1101]|uniref:Do family serine endopeptidase n=1 Tax=Marinicella marina TaxID=2996016 RepID=UPI002260FF6F|nr:Do family serine endopeptidase [Marinicella marina]MCX7555019.1 Do family serine endopeptidase [Marinicella marina]MDJ1141317.1 Do family serine endopeptidase [Marinicella marina]
MRKLFIIAILATFSGIGLAKQMSLPDFTQLAETTGPAVVNIVARDNAEENETNAQQPNEELFRFFGIPNQPQNRDRVSGGSGFIISADGLILTNRHVIDGADKITVTLLDRREYEAELIGEDEASDIAVLKIDGENLPKLAIGSAEDLKIGEWVMAIGSPLSFENTVTKGIVSAKGRAIGNQQYVPFIQSDVPINRGNSGGPLINLDGEVVGINTLIFSSTGGYMGISFSVPIDVAMNVAEQLQKNGTVKRGLLGVGIGNVNQAMADYLGMEKPMGALVNQVSPGSSAEKAGIEIGDVIISFDGSSIKTSQSLPPVVGRVMPDTDVALQVFRDGKVKTLTAKLDALSDDLQANSNSNNDDEVAAGIGFSVSKLSEQDKERTGENSGVIVTDITDKDVERANLRVGDVIKRIGKKADVSDLSDFSDAIDELDEDEPLVLLVSRGGGNTFIVIER